MSDGSLGDRHVNPTPLGSIGAQDLLRVAYTKYGFLRKQNKIFSKIEEWTGKSMKWSRVFVIISQGCVYIYDNDKSKTIKNAFSLQGYDRVGRMDMKGILNSFAIYPERYYDDARNIIQFAATTEGERLEWMQCLYGCLLLVNKETPPDEHVLRLLDYDTIERSITSTDPKNVDSKDSHYDSIDESKMVKEQKPKRYNPFPVAQKTTPKTRQEATSPSTAKSTPSSASAGIEYDDTAWSTKTSPPLPDLTRTKKKPLPVYTGETYDDTIAGPSTSSPPHDAIRDRGGATRMLPRSDSIYVNTQKENEDDDDDDDGDSSSDSDGRSYENELKQDYMFPYSDTQKARECLQDKPIQTFLIRDSTAGDKKTLQLKMKDGIKKYQINIENGQFYFALDQKFDSLDGLVKYYQDNDMPSLRSRLGFGYKHYENR